jgi:hypothetical protein
MCFTKNTVKNINLIKKTKILNYNFEHVEKQQQQQIIRTKMNSINLYSLFSTLITVHAINSNYYIIKKNANINTTIIQTWLNSSFNTKTKYSCLSQCNKNNFCLNLVYTNSTLNKNCFLFTKNFTSTELVSSIDSDLYIKDIPTTPITSTSTKTSTTVIPDDTSCIISSIFNFKIFSSSTNNFCF